jgi:hypothetical protein
MDQIGIVIYIVQNKGGFSLVIRENNDGEDSNNR